MDFVTLPKEVVVVEIKRPQRRRGLASTNNYLESLGKKDTKKEDEVSKNPYLEEVRDPLLKDAKILGRHHAL